MTMFTAKVCGTCWQSIPSLQHKGMWLCLRTNREHAPQRHCNYWTWRWDEPAEAEIAALDAAGGGEE
jgi:hypothetical protein